MTSRFVSIDLEMANNNLSSICQLGIVVYENFEIISQWETLVNPLTDFGFYQTQVHGITKEQVQLAPTLPELRDQIINTIKGQVVSSYGMNDLYSLAGNFALPKCTWMDASKVTKAVWPHLGKGKSSLRGACEANDIIISNHHNALDDAIALGSLINCAMRNNAFSLKQLLGYSKKEIQEGYRYTSPAVNKSLI